MPFNSNDIYTSSGSVNLQNAWTPYVSKFDTSTFYNWEQDNLPLYDLEERTYELWEQQGYPTSSVPGMSLVVSADAPEETLAANPNIFATVSACIAAIPKVVRFPVLVEVCNFGDLGDLELHNIRIEEGGSIEIINRGFVRSYSSSTIAAAKTATPTLNGSNPVLASISSLDFRSYLNDASSVILSSTVLSSTVAIDFSTYDSRLSSTPNYSFYSVPHTDRKSLLSFSEDQLFSTGIPLIVSRRPYENLVADDSTLSVHDISAVSEYDNSRETYRGDLRVYADSPVGNKDTVTGIYTTNHFNKISVKNCDGPIYIRQFIVDGGRTSSLGSKVGINILNSDVVLEDCGVSKCKDAGFRFNNSKVVLSRSAYSYRNYDIESTTVRVPDTGIGFDLINSDVTLSADITGSLPTSLTDASGEDIVFCASRNDIGWRLSNSTLRRGLGRGTVTDAGTAGITTSELNTTAGFLLHNSTIDLDGVLDSYGNKYGIKSNNSKVNFYQLSIEGNNLKGIEARNSIFTFDSKDINLPSNDAGQGIYPERHQVDFYNNGQHIHLDSNSIFTFERTTAMPSKFGSMFFSGCHGAVSWGGAVKGNKPAIQVTNGSIADFIHFSMDSRLESEVFNSPTYGLAVQALNNSKVSFYGTGSGCTAIFNRSVDGDGQFAGVYGGHNSTVNLHGPTVIGQLGVDVLVEDNSVLNISPPKDEFAGLPDVSGFSLQDPLNHTSVELHALRSCLVVHRNSVINIEDAGDFHNFWKNTSTGQDLLAAGTDYNDGNGIDTSAYLYRGSLQFYPNAYGDVLPSETGGLPLVESVIDSIDSFPTFTKGLGDQNVFLANDYADSDYTTASAISIGGMCLRALGNSEVNVRNVHFPLANNPSPMDGLYYTASGTDCDRLMIWNIADTSRLHASFLSVSGSYPGDAGYHGPSAIYVSATSPDLVAYGAPSSTPDTGTLSILDQYGAGSSVWVAPENMQVNDPFDNIWLSSIGAPTNALQYGTSGGLFNNQGLFRIYYSVDSAAKLLATVEGEVGIPYQIFSQGYNCSGDVSALIPDEGAELSSLYPNLLKYNGSELTTSGFYYCKEFVQDNPTQVIVDESASNTFANSKNGMTGQSGKPKKVTLIRSRLGGTTGATQENRGSESYQGDTGIHRSSTIFDLERLL